MRWISTPTSTARCSTWSSCWNTSTRMRTPPHSVSDCRPCSDAIRCTSSCWDWAPNAPATSPRPLRTTARPLNCMSPNTASTPHWPAPTWPVVIEHRPRSRSSVRATTVEASRRKPTPRDWNHCAANPTVEQSTRSLAMAEVRIAPEKLNLLLQRAVCLTEKSCEEGLQRFGQDRSRPCKVELYGNWYLDQSGTLLRLDAGDRLLRLPQL